MSTYQYDLVKKLSFLRYGGTEGEHRAAEYILDEIKMLGGKGEAEEFFIPASRCNLCRVKIAEPYEQELEVMPWGLSGSLPSGGVDLELFYAEDGLETALSRKKDFSSTAVMLNDINSDIYKTLCEKSAAAIIVISGKWYDTDSADDFLFRQLRPSFLKYGRIPTFSIGAKDAMTMVENEASLIQLELEQEEFENISHNITASIPGTEIPEESIIITAHYDSVNIGTGAYDNATGSATAMYIYKYFLKNPPKRTLRFLWCGSEEQGLYGSKAYISAHREEIENEIKLCFNFDMCGIILGTSNVSLMGDDKLKCYAEEFCREYALDARVVQEVRSSDSACFADVGIPCIDLVRRCKMASIHTRYDLIDIISAKQLEKDGNCAISFIEKLANEACFSIVGGMPDEMKDKLDKYFKREKKG